MSNDKQETIPMGKTVMVLVIPEPKVRKAVSYTHLTLPTT